MPGGIYPGRNYAAESFDPLLGSDEDFLLVSSIVAARWPDATVVTVYI